MFAFDLKKGEAHFVTNNHVFFSTSNHSVGVRTDFTTSTTSVLDGVQAISTNSALANNSRILSIRDHKDSECLLYKSIVPAISVAANSNIVFGDGNGDGGGNAFSAIHIGSNVIHIGGGKMVFTKAGEKLGMPYGVLNLVDKMDHVFYNPALRYVIPPGVLIPYGGMVNTTLTNAEFVPKGYLPCDGRACSVSEFPRLYSVLGYTYGGSSGSFQLPDFRARSPHGNYVGNVSMYGGTSNVALDQATTMARHTHTIQYLRGDFEVNQGEYGLLKRSIAGFNSCATTGTSNVYPWDVINVPNGREFETQESGETVPTPFSIMHPYTLVHFLIKT